MTHWLSPMSTMAYLFVTPTGEWHGETRTDNNITAPTTKRTAKQGRHRLDKNRTGNLSSQKQDHKLSRPHHRWHLELQCFLPSFLQLQLHYLKTWDHYYSRWRTNANVNEAWRHLSSLKPQYGSNIYMGREWRQASDLLYSYMILGIYPNRSAFSKLAMHHRIFLENSRDHLQRWKDPEMENWNHDLQRLGESRQEHESHTKKTWNNNNNNNKKGIIGVT